MARDDGGGDAAEFDLVVGGLENLAESAHGVGFEDGVADARRELDDIHAGLQGVFDIGAVEPGEGLGGGDARGSAERAEVQTR